MGYIRRYGKIVILEHWVTAISGIMLIFTGLGCLPLFKRYYITEIPGFSWTSDFYTLTELHYIFAVFFTLSTIFHATFHSLRKDFGLIPKKGDLSASVKMILSSFGVGKEPPSDKWLPEQKFAYLAFALVILALIVTGIIKVLKNLEWVLLSPGTESILNLLHTIFGGLFILLFLVHIFFALVIKSNWPLLKAIFTGFVSEDYVKKRHVIWYQKLIRDRNSP